MHIGFCDEWLGAYAPVGTGAFPFVIKSLLSRGLPDGNEIPEDDQQAWRVGKWLDKRSPMLQCCEWILVGRGAREGDLLGCVGCDRGGGDCLVTAA